MLCLVSAGSYTDAHQTLMGLHRSRSNNTLHKAPKVQHLDIYMYMCVLYKPSPIHPLRMNAHARNHPAWWIDPLLSLVHDWCVDGTDPGVVGECPRLAHGPSDPQPTVPLTRYHPHNQRTSVFPIHPDAIIRGSGAILANPSTMNTRQDALHIVV